MARTALITDDSGRFAPYRRAWSGAQRLEEGLHEAEDSAVGAEARQALADLRTCARGDEPRRRGQDRHSAAAVEYRQRSGERPERAADDRALHMIEQQRVVHDADTAADVVDGVAG